MSEELALETKSYIAKALKKAQDSHSSQGWCHRKPKHWALTAQHIIQQPSTVTEFRKKHGITKNFYYDTKAELLADPECQEIRNAWGSEVASLTFEGLDTHRMIMNKFGDAIESGEIEVDENVVFKSVKGLQGLTDIHGKLTGNNVQKHIVEHVHTKEDFADKEAELERKYNEMKKAEKSDPSIIEVD
jgi:hypothetical protein